jgi:ubiquinone/menaquinone biosynthesis C-methylase UbiE
VSSILTFTLTPSPTVLIPFIKVSNLFIMEFVHPTEGWLAPLSNLFLSRVLPLLGWLSARGHTNEYQHLADSIQRFPPAKEFVKEIETAGFSNCRAENVFFHIVYIFSCEKQS